MKWSFLYRLRKCFLYHDLYFKFCDKQPLKLHLGCGSIYIDNWVNIDSDKKIIADLYMNITNLNKVCKPGSVDEIMTIHVISYLRLWEAKDFVADCYSLLRPGGKLVMEFPDVAKIAGKMTSIQSLDTAENRFQYDECLRAIYAFDPLQVAAKEKFTTYSFGWSGIHMKYELEKIGFHDVKIIDPEYHDVRIWRDTRNQD